MKKLISKEHKCANLKLSTLIFYNISNCPSQFSYTLINLQYFKWWKLLNLAGACLVPVPLHNPHLKKQKQSSATKNIIKAILTCKKNQKIILSFNKIKNNPHLQKGSKVNISKLCKNICTYQNINSTSSSTKVKILMLKVQKLTGGPQSLFQWEYLYQMWLFDTKNQFTF